MFTRHTGTFENGDLEIQCADIYPMDLGSPGFTQFKMDETVTSYIADNIDLFDCDIQLIHSHNQMSCFFSGTDTQTLREEGNDRNCFVSLIVNNAGTYCAAVTRKMQTSTEVVTKSLGTSYEFFGDGPIKTEEDPITESTRVINKEVIEYFMLDVEVERVDNPLDYLDARFVEIEEKKKKDKPVVPTSNYTRVYDPKKGDTVLLPKAGNDYDYDKDDKDESFYDWIHSNRKNSAEAKEGILFDNSTMEELIDASKWQPDSTIIHHLVCQLVTCSLIVNADIDLKQWVTKHMEKKYTEIFSDASGMEFTNWSEMYVEFILNHYNDLNVPADVYDDWDEYLAKIAEAMIDELNKYPDNGFIDEYKDILNRYLGIES